MFVGYVGRAGTWMRGFVGGVRQIVEGVEWVMWVNKFWLGFTIWCGCAFFLMKAILFTGIHRFFYFAVFRDQLISISIYVSV